MTNANYGIRPVTMAEVLTLCGTARRALQVTGGCDKLALFYIHNPEKVAGAGEVSERETELRDKLKAQAKAEEYRERVKAAAQAFSPAGTLSAVMRAVRCGRPMARELVESARGWGLIQDRPVGTTSA